MAARGEKGSKIEAEAGARNLALHNQQVAEGNAEPGRLKHGAFSQVVRQRYSDRRTREGQQLAAVMSSLVDDLGGQTAIDAGQRILLDRVGEKLIILMQLGRYADEHPNIINFKGELIPCLGTNYLSFSNSLRKDLQALYEMARAGNGKNSVPTIEQIIEGSE